jgi:hypothetical protein
MSPLWEKASEVVLRLVAKAASGPGFLANAIRTATLSVGQVLAKLLKMGIADDVRQLKEDGLRRSRARTGVEEARVRELMAKAAEAENRANLVNRNDRIMRAEELQKLASAAKTNAEAKALLTRVETERATARADAVVRLIDSLAKLRENGGSLGIDPNNISTLLGISDLDELDYKPPQIHQSKSHGSANHPTELGGKSRSKNKRRKRK